MFSKAKKWDGQLLHILARTGEESYVGMASGKAKSKMKNAMPQMIALLDSTRHLLEELSPELGVTDPVSGTVVFEK